MENKDKEQYETVVRVLTDSITAANMRFDWALTQYAAERIKAHAYQKALENIFNIKGENIADVLKHARLIAGDALKSQDEELSKK